MKKTRSYSIFIIAFICIFIELQAQNYSDLILQANSYYKSKNFLQSARTFDDAFLLKDGSKSEYYNAACSWALEGNNTLALEYLCMAADKGWANINHLMADSDLTSLHESEEWYTISNIVKANHRRQNQFGTIKHRLEKIYVKDQTLRWLLVDAEAKFGRESDHMKFYRTLMATQDSINEIRIVKILDDHGWLGIDEVGKKGNKTIWLVIQHSPIETQEKYLPLLKKSVQDSQSLGNHLAMLEDRILMSKKEPQIYGSQIITNKVTGKKEVYKIKDPEYVDQRRRQVGLEPIAEYLNTWGIKWDIKQN